MTRHIAPQVCLNCGHLEGIEPNTPQGTDASLPVAGRCAWGPTHVRIIDARSHRCGQRKPLDEPVYTVPVPEEGQVADGALDGVSAPQSEEGEADA